MRDQDNTSAIGEVYYENGRVDFWSPLHTLLRRFGRVSDYGVFVVQ